MSSPSWLAQLISEPQPPWGGDHCKCALPGPDLLYMGLEVKLGPVTNTLLTEPSLLVELLILKEQN